MPTTDIIQLMMIVVILLSGLIPITIGIIYYARENRRLVREEKNAHKAASRQ